MTFIKFSNVRFVKSKIFDNMKYLTQSGGNRNKIDKIDKNFNLKIEFMKVDIFRIGR